MADSVPPSTAAGAADEPLPARVKARPAQPQKKSISMHEDVPVWYDCCSCEAEPYWAELADEAEDSSA